MGISRPARRACRLSENPKAGGDAGSRVAWWQVSWLGIAKGPVLVGDPTALSFGELLPAWLTKSKSRITRSAPGGRHRAASSWGRPHHVRWFTPPHEITDAYRRRAICNRPGVSGALSLEASLHRVRP
jgi:hypothetical protein